MSLVKRQRTDVSRHDVESRNGLLYSEAVVLEGHGGFVLSSKFSPDGAHIASGGMDKTIRLWLLPSDSSDDSPNYGVLTGHKNAVTSVAWLNDESVVSGSADALVGFWDTVTGQRTRKAVGHELTVNEVVQCGTEVLSVSDDGTARVWDGRSKSHLLSIETEYPLLTGTASGSIIVYVAGIDPTVKAFDLRKPVVPLWTCKGHNEAATSVALSSDGAMLVSRAMNGKVTTYNARDTVVGPRHTLLMYDGAPSGKEYQLIRLRYSPNNVWIASGAEDYTLTVWDTATRRVNKKHEGHTGTVVDVDFHPTGKAVLTASTDGLMIVREI